MENYDGWYVYKAKPLRLRCKTQVKLDQAQTGQTISKTRPRVGLNKKRENSESLDMPSDLTQGANTILTKHLTKHLAKILAYETAYGAVHACVIGTVLSWTLLVHTNVSGMRAKGN